MSCRTADQQSLFFDIQNLAFHKSRSTKVTAELYSFNPIHFSLSSNLLTPACLADGLLEHWDFIPTKMCLHYAQETPCLMHQLLAAAASHRSIARPAKSVRYRRYAICLQTRASSALYIPWRTYRSKAWHCSLCRCWRSLWFIQLDVRHHRLIEWLQHRSLGSANRLVCRWLTNSGALYAA